MLLKTQLLTKLTSVNTTRSINNTFIRSASTKKNVIKPYVNKEAQFAIELETAARMLKAVSIGKEWSSVELIVTFNRTNFNRVLLGSTLLPKPVAQETKLLVFAEGKHAEAAKEAGAHIVGGPELILQIQDGVSMEFDRVITTTAMLKHVAKIARILGPLGLMPTVKKGNVTDDVVKAINETNAQFDFKSDSQGVVKAPIGKVTFSEQELVDNALAIVKTIHEIGQPTCKEQFVEKVYIKSSQSPAILIKDLNKRFVVEEEEE